jgi:hypothetical protein
MSPELHIQQVQRQIHPVDGMTGEAIRLDDMVAQLMAVQRYWNAPNRQAHLATALNDSRTVWQGIQAMLAAGTLALPLDVQQNLLILSVYADSKISACEASPSVETLGSLIALTHTLAGSLRDWQEAA